MRRKLWWYNRKVLVLRSKHGYIIRSGQSLPGLYDLETQVFGSLSDAKTALANFRKKLRSSAPRLKQRTLYQVSWLPPDSGTWQHRQFRRMGAVKKFVRFITLNDLSMEPADVEMARYYRADAIRRRVWWVADAKGNLVKLAHS